mmetsp:Transcript_5027/g.9683  ORF Transcript_5027/g.9683 Transcript_5027/m.9683 type:complete len:123 (-) Transcript_5027:226-594(-)
MGAACCSQDPAPKVETTNETPDEFTATAVDTTPTLTITFRTNNLHDSAKRVVNFKQSPLGMSFSSQSTPIVIKDVMEGGEAENLGVKQGMVIEKIGDEDITAVTYSDAFASLKSMVEKLPQA